MWWLLLLVPVVLLVFLFRPTAFTVKRSRRIAKPRAQIFAKVRELRSWPDWSPWLIAEPDANLDYTGDSTAVGGKYAWDGDIVGAGEIEHQAIDEPSRLDLEIRFTRPFTSIAKVAFDFKDTDDGTEVTWTMHSKMPSIMVSMFRSLIGMDYDRGLHMLGDLLEKGSIDSRLEVHGIVDCPALDWIGMESTCPIVSIGDSMEKTFADFKQRLTDGGVVATGPWRSFYTRWDFKTSTCSYIIAAPVDGTPAIEGTTTGHVPTHRAYRVTHHGPYDHLGNAWSVAHSHTRAKKYKCAKGGPFPYEIYTTDPDETDPADLQTDIHIPVR